MSVSAPVFRRAEPGYDPEDVDEHVATARELVTALEQRVVDLTDRALAAEAAAAKAEVHAPAFAPDDDELLAVVFEGQRRADDLLARAEEQVAALRRQADTRIAELRDDREVRRLSAAIEDTRRRLQETREALVRVDDDLRAAAEATRDCRVVVGERLAAAFADLALGDGELVTNW